MSIFSAYTDACTSSCKIVVASKRPLIFFDWREPSEDSRGEFQKKDERKLTKSQTVTWMLGNSTLRLIFTGDLYNVYR